MQEHLLCCNYSLLLEDFSVLNRESNEFKLKMMESFPIVGDKRAYFFLIDLFYSQVELPLNKVYNLQS